MKYKLRKVFFSFILAVTASVLFALPALAGPVDPTPRTVEQSCGAQLVVRFLGDEFIHWQETLAGDVIAYCRESNNWYYAYVNDGEIRPGSEKAKSITPFFGGRVDTITTDDMCVVFEAANYYRTQFESRLRPINLTNNRIPLLTLLIEFEDRQFSDFYLCAEFPTLTSFWSNEKFGSEGKTVNTYFAQSSHDFDLQFIKPPFTVADGFRVENPTPEVSLLEIRDGVVRARVNAPHPNPANLADLSALNTSVINAFNAAREHVDFTNIPRSPGTNLVQAGTITSENFMVTTVIAGYEASASGGAQPRINGHARPGAWSIGVNGNLSAYAVIGELTYSSSTGLRLPMGIGGTIHEIGHLFGLPDLYGQFPIRPSLGAFSVMCFGSHMSAVANGRPGSSPSLFDPWSKIQLGFIKPTVINASEHRLVDMYGMDASNAYNVIQVISDVDPDQHFLIENRRAVGFDAPLSRSNAHNHGNIPRGEGGILIYHIDDRVLRDERLGGQRRSNVNSNDFHRGVDLEAMMTPESGDRNSFNFNPFFVQGGLRYTFSPDTTPNSNFHTPGLCNDHRLVSYNCHPQTVVSNIHIQANDSAGQVIEVEFGLPESKPCCPIVAQGRLPDQVGGEGLRGAPWTLCECGILTVSEGFIHWEEWESPWAAHRSAINEIVFTGPITAGESLDSLFSWLSNVTIIEGLEHFDTSRTTNMNLMFMGASSLTTLDVSNWDTSNVVGMGAMFAYTNSLTTLDVSNWDTSNVISMEYMFFGANSLTALDVSNWDTSNVVSMYAMFARANSLTTLDVSNWDTSNVVSMGTMFMFASSLTALDVSNWDTSNVRYMLATFWGTSSLTTLDVSNWDTSNVVNMDAVFGMASSLTALDLSNWDMRGLWLSYCSGSTINMLLGTTALRSLTLGENSKFPGDPLLPAISATSEFTGYWQNVGDGTPERPQGTHVLTSAQLMSQFNGATMADTWVWQSVIAGCPIVAQGRLPDQVGGEGLRGAPWTLCECGVLTVSEGFIHQTSIVGRIVSPWDGLRNDITNIVFTGPIAAGSSLESLFSNLRNVETIEGLEHFDTINATSMEAMFSNAHSLTSLDLSNWNTSNVTRMGNMFHATNSLVELDVSTWDTGRVTNMAFMFMSASSLTTLDVSSWDTSRVTNMNIMFGNTPSLTTLDVSSWDTSRVTSMNNMLFNTAALRTLTLGEDFAFRGTPNLPAISATSEFTGYWQNVGDGTPERPQGTYVLTSAQLMSQFNGATMADTWVWQPR